MASTVTNSITQLCEIPQETLDKLVLTPDAKEFYSQDNELKKLLIERETYKKAYETQQKNIDEFTTQWDKAMNMPVSTRTWTIENGDGFKQKYKCTQTLRDYVREEYYKNIFKTIRFDTKLENEIKYFKDFKF